MNTVTPLLLTDTHCHLDFSPLVEQGTELLLSCQTLGIHRIIIPTVGPSNWQTTLQLTDALNQHNTVRCYPALGIHPWYIDTCDQHDLANLEQLARENQQKIIAIGECGIDGAKAKHLGNLAAQIHFFEQQIKLANQLKLPLIVHHRQSHNDILACFKRHKPLYGGVIHAFSGSYQQAMSYYDLGFKLGIGGTISYDRAKKTRNTTKRLPLDALLLETDAPSMPLQHQQHNSPVNIKVIFEILCSLRTESAELIAERLEQNLLQTFGIR
jgi:TatD DNase family protein